MDNNSRETLRRVTQNNPSLKTLSLDDYNTYGDDGQFHSDNSDDYSTLGAAIANNTHLEKLEVTLSDDIPLGVSDREFYDGLKRNSSVSNLELWCNSQTIAGGIWHEEILKVYQENNSHLTYLYISDANLQNGGDRAIVDTLRSCSHLQTVVLKYCNMTDEQLLPIVDAIRGHRILEELYLGGNRIGNAGCEAIATLLIDPSCNVHTLDLGSNAITAEGATTIANSLTNNNKLQTLYMGGNQIDQSIEDIFCKVLCNTSNIGHTYASNHTLQTFHFGGQPLSQHLESLLKLNKDTDNEHHASIKKILKYHPNIDVEPLFEWGLEDDDEERNLKALPHVINWFERTKVAVADDGKEYGIEERKLSATFQFAKAMPLLLEGISRIKVDKKRKKSE